MKKIFYLGYYDTVDNKAEKRDVCLAATNKMTYIVSALEKAGYEVELFSASQTKDKKNSYKGKTVKIGNHSKLVLFKTLPWGNKIQKLLSIINSKYQLYRYIIKNIGKNDTLIVYHSLGYSKIVCTLKRIIKFKLVLETEEIYSDVIETTNSRALETKIFNLADAFILSTELLNEKINKQNKPHCAIYGTYNVEENRNCKFNDDKIHIVYAGTFHPLKGGAATSISAAEFLDSRYHLHIIGFGNDEDTATVKKQIEEISKKTNCKLTYDGMLTGEDYIRFLQSCHIGLSTQNPDAEYNDTSFPSKILSYMANGLNVVTVKIKVLEQSNINSMLYYYEKSNGEEIAKAIMNIDLSKKYDSREIIVDLDKKFVSAISKILGD